MFREPVIVISASFSVLCSQLYIAVTFVVLSFNAQDNDVLRSLILSLASYNGLYAESAWRLAYSAGSVSFEAARQEMRDIAVVILTIIAESCWKLVEAIHF